MEDRTTAAKRIPPKLSRFWMTIREACDALCVTEMTIWRLRKEKKVIREHPTGRFGRVLLSRKEVENLLSGG